MAKSAKNNKDKEMAAYLKKKGVKRTTGTCPVNHKHKGIPNGKLIEHFAMCR